MILYIEYRPYGCVCFKVYNKIFGNVRLEMQLSYVFSSFENLFPEMLFTHDFFYSYSMLKGYESYIPVEIELYLL